jgi:hypothetical protein
LEGLASPLRGRVNHRLSTNNISEGLRSKSRRVDRIRLTTVVIVTVAVGVYIFKEDSISVDISGSKPVSDDGSNRNNDNNDDNGGQRNSDNKDFGRGMRSVASFTCGNVSVVAAVLDAIALRPNFAISSTTPVVIRTIGSSASHLSALEHSV